VGKGTKHASSLLDNVKKIKATTGLWRNVAVRKTKKVHTQQGLESSHRYLMPSLSLFTKRDTSHRKVWWGKLNNQQPKSDGGTCAVSPRHVSADTSVRI